MESIINLLFKPHILIKFESTDADYFEIVHTLQNSKLFNVKASIGKLFTPSTEINILTSTKYSYEKYLFLDISIIINSEGTYIYNNFLYDNLQDLYNAIINLETSYIDFFNNSYNKILFFKNNYLLDKKQADKYFINKKYKNAYKIYMKYVKDSNDFSNYCLEMSIYCCLILKTSLPIFDKSFKQSYYFQRLLYVLYHSNENDFYMYQILNKEDENWMELIGLRFINNEKYKRLGARILFFIKNNTKYKSLKEMYLKKFNNNILFENKSYKNTNVSMWSKILLNEDNNIIKNLNTSSECVNLSYIIYQYQIFYIEFKGIIHKNYYIEIDNYNQKVESGKKIQIWYQKPGTFYKTLVMHFKTRTEYKIKFTVFPFFKVNRIQDYKIKSFIYVNIECINFLSTTKNKINFETIFFNDESQNNLNKNYLDNIYIKEHKEKYKNKIAHSNQIIKNNNDIEKTKFKQNDFSFSNKINLYKMDNDLINNTNNEIIKNLENSGEKIKFINTKISKIKNCINKKQKIVLKSKQKFNPSDGDILNIIKRNILGIEQNLLFPDDFDKKNSVLCTSLSFKKFLVNNYKKIKFSNNISLQLYNKLNNLYFRVKDLKFRLKINKFNVNTDKIFIFIFNNYKMENLCRINLLVNNYYKIDLYLTILSDEISVIDQKHLLKSFKSSLIEVRCLLGKCDKIKFKIKIKDEIGICYKYETIYSLVL